MNWTEDDLIALDKAIATGAKRVQYHDKFVEYKTTSEQLAIRRLIIAWLYPAVAGRSNRVYASFSKGLR